MLGIGYKPMNNMSYQEVMTSKREDVDTDLIFLGFLIMQNKLKSATIKTIQELNNASVRTIMATGDNMLTALSVGRKCGIIHPDLAVYLCDVAPSGSIRKI